MRIALAKLLIRKPDLLLLDEPTNHLDLESVKWLEGFLRGYDGAVVVVSHDRAFMDNMVDRVAEIDAGRLELYKGNYSAYLKQRDERIERLRQQAERQAEEIAHMEAFIEKFRYKPTKAKQVQDRVKKLEKIERIVVPQEKKTVHFNFVQPPRGLRLLERRRDRALGLRRGILRGTRRRRAASFHGSCEHDVWRSGVFRRLLFGVRS